MIVPAVETAHGFVVEVHERPEDAVRSGWDEAVLAAGAPVFYRSHYLTAYHRHPLADIDHFGYLLVREATGGAPLAAVPVARYARPDPLGALRAIHPGIAEAPALLSHVWHCYDTHLVGAADRPELVAAVLTAMRTLAAHWGAQWYGLVNVPRDSPTAAALTAAGLPGRHLVDRFVADLSGLRDLDDYLARLRPRARANLVRNRRRAADAGLHATTVPVSEADLEEIGELAARTAGRFGSTGFYPTATFARFVTELARLDDCVHILQVRHAGRLVAVGVCLTDERRFHTWTCGVDYDTSTWGVGSDTSTWGVGSDTSTWGVGSDTSTLGVVSDTSTLGVVSDTSTLGVVSDTSTWGVVSDTSTCGVDYDVPGRASPYALLFAESVALALRLGRPVLEGGRSNAVFKQRHGLTARHLDAHVARVDGARVEGAAAP